MLSSDVAVEVPVVASDEVDKMKDELQTFMKNLS